MFSDPENVYNLHGVNNEHAIGYENIFERSAANNPVENYQAAHESVFDKLLADYFLSKRGEYKEANNLAGELAKVFESKHMSDYKASNSMDHLLHTKYEQDAGKHAEPRISNENFRDMINLDVLTNRALNKSKSGMTDEFAHISCNETDHKEFIMT